MLRLRNKIFCCDNLKLLKRLPNCCIDLIYCDVLYGTGKKYKEYTDLKCNRRIIENFYRPRIQQIHRALKNDGSIYLQMDWRISHWIRLLMDEVFGYENLINEIVWCYGAGGFNKKLVCNPKHDIIFLYSKTEMYTNNMLVENKARIKSWWRIKSIADKSGYLQHDNEKCCYSTQKPEALLERIILASSNEGDLIADFFCGSGTAGVVAKKLNRKYLLCDNSDKAIQITKSRIKECRD